MKEVRAELRLPNGALLTGIPIRRVLLYCRKDSEVSFQVQYWQDGDEHTLQRSVLRLEAELPQQQVPEIEAKALLGEMIEQMTKAGINVRLAE